MASATQNSAGCAASVAVSASIGPSRQSCRIGNPDAASACSKIALEQLGPLGQQVAAHADFL